ncbi:helix-turn-helix transcriptional regulator [Lacticaseibacillus zhaodongensis]|uniref:helix-turn-helix transcriptional regulator n=1 Tax=Lacticaseibacillus zhaodongensis TaxID=2668065 RepID=UPI0012D2AADD|nr:helix-turn-helix domain-containing protein [Lacticaseibacillus zhaodongensis]
MPAHIGGKGKVAGYRVMAHMTQGDVASYLGITRQTYNMKERGINAFTDKEKLKMRTLFQQRVDQGLTIDAIFFQ